MPSLWLVTDPKRTPDPEAAARRLPRGSGIIYRAFGAPDALAVTTRLAAIARKRGQVLLVGADEGLAMASGAHGLHLPERLLPSGRRIRARHPQWLITGAAHSASALARAAGAGLDAAFLSAVFESASPSAGPAMGPLRLALLARHSPLPVIALGGVNERTAPRLIGTGAAGLAGVEGLLPGVRSAAGHPG